MARQTFSSNDVILKSPNNRRLYRLIKLENGLTALLVHDHEIGESQLPKGSEEVEMEKEEEEEEEAMEEDEDEEYDDEEDEDSEGEDEEMDEDGEGEDEDGLKKKKGGDSQTKKAAAAMCVGIGSFSGPPEAQGLAHFLEHMLFMGSTEFRDGNELFAIFWWKRSMIDKNHWKFWDGEVVFSE